MLLEYVEDVVLSGTYDEVVLSTEDETESVTEAVVLSRDEEMLV